MTEKYNVKAQERRRCCLCQGEIDVRCNDEGVVIWALGHNAEPLGDGRCCTTCNATRVIPERFAMMRGMRENRR